MFDFAKKLLFARQLNIERGSLTILNHRFLFMPTKTVAKFIMSSGDIKPLYYSCKETGKDFADFLIKEFNAKTIQKLEELLINIFNLAGWGELEIIKNDMKNSFAIFHIKNSSVAMDYGKSNKPICHTNRGFLASGASRIYKIDVDCIETKCISVGNMFCEFIATNKNYLAKTYPALVKSQL